MRLTPASLVLGIAIVAAFLLLGQYAPQEQPALFNQFAVVPARYNIGAPGGYQDWGAALAPLFGHVFFHYGLMHIVMNGWAYVQVAPFLAARVGDVRFLAIFFISALGGAAAFILINANTDTAAVGASGAICGLFGAFFLAVRPTPQAAFADPRVRGAMLSFLAINVVLVALLPLPIAWEAHMGGFFAGALAYLALTPRQRSTGPWG